MLDSALKVYKYMNVQCGCQIHGFCRQLGKGSVGIKVGEISEIYKYK